MTRGRCGCPAHERGMSRLPLPPHGTVLNIMCAQPTAARMAVGDDAGDEGRAVNRSFTALRIPARAAASTPRLGCGAPARVTAVGARQPPPQPHPEGAPSPPRRLPRPPPARLCLFARCAPRALRAARTGGCGFLLTTSFQPPRPPSQAHPPASWLPTSDPARWQVSEGLGASGSAVAPEVPQRHQLLAACTRATVGAG